MKELKKDSFILIKPFMVTELKLKGNSLLLFALIYGITVNEGAFYGSIEYMQTWCNSSNRSVLDCLQELTKKGLIIKKKSGNTVFYTANILEESEESSYQSEESSLASVKKVHSKCEESSHNNINKEFEKKEFINSPSTTLKSEPPKFDISKTKKKRVTETEKHEEYLSSLFQAERDESAKCVDLFIELHKQLDPCYNRDKSRLAWQVEFAKYHKESTRSFDQIQVVLKYGMNDEFWKTRLSSPKILFNAFETILQQSMRTSSYRKKSSDSVERVNQNTDKDYTIF